VSSRHFRDRIVVVERQRHQIRFSIRPRAESRASRALHIFLVSVRPRARVHAVILTSLRRRIARERGRARGAAVATAIAGLDAQERGVRLQKFWQSARVRHVSLGPRAFSRAAAAGAAAAGTAARTATVEPIVADAGVAVLVGEQVRLLSTSRHRGTLWRAPRARAS